MFFFIPTINPADAREDFESKLFSTTPLGSINTVNTINDVGVSPKHYRISSMS